MNDPGDRSGEGRADRPGGQSAEDTFGETAIPGDRSERGFTLVELMITVAIVAVLAILAMVGYSRWIKSAKTAEATSVVSSIKGQQDTYRAETLRYLNCLTNSTAAGTGANLGSPGGGPTYPAGAPTGQKRPFNLTACGGDLVCASFRKLNVQADANVYYAYSCVAGPADNTAVTGYNAHAYGNASDVWAIIRAVGDLDGNGQYSVYESSTFDSTIWSVNGDE